MEPLGAHLGGSGGGSGGAWGALWGVRGRLGPFLAALEPIFVVLARSWASLGRSWVALGPLLAALGPLLGGSWPLLGRSWRLWELQVGASWAPKWLRKRFSFEKVNLQKVLENLMNINVFGTKIALKTSQDGPRTAPRPLLAALVPLLGCSWPFLSALGPLLNGFWCLLESACMCAGVCAKVRACARVCVRRPWAAPGRRSPN